MQYQSNTNTQTEKTMITARHLSGTRKTFSDPDEIIRFMRKDPSADLWQVDIDGFKATGKEVASHGKLSTGGYQTKTLTPRKTGKSYKELLSEIRTLQSDIHDRQAKLSAVVPQRESAPVPDQGKNFQITYSLTNQ